MWGEIDGKSFVIWLASSIRPEFFRVFEGLAARRRCFNVRIFAGSLPFDSRYPVFAAEGVSECTTIIGMNLIS